MKLANERAGDDPRRRVTRPFHILALDPGGTTGISRAYWVPQDPQAKLITLDQIHFSQDNLGPDEHHSLLWEYLQSETQYFESPGHPTLEIVCESFEFRQHYNPQHFKAKVVLVSKEYIGIIRLFCLEYNISLSFQTASAAKTFVPDSKIKAISNLWRPGMTHSNDATRHLLRHLVITKHIREPITDKWVN